MLRAVGWPADTTAPTSGRAVQPTTCVSTVLCVCGGQSQGVCRSAQECRADSHSSRPPKNSWNSAMVYALPSGARRRSTGLPWPLPLPPLPLPLPPPGDGPSNRLPVAAKAGGGTRQMVASGMWQRACARRFMHLGSGADPAPMSCRASRALQGNLRGRRSTVPPCPS